MPFCDQLGRLQGNWQDDTAFFRTNLAVTRPLNDALHGLVLSNRPHFAAGLLSRLFSPSGRLTRHNYATLDDPRTRAYLQPLVDRPNRYYYHSERLTFKEAVWEFDDTHSEGLRVRVINAGRYKCFEY